MKRVQRTEGSARKGRGHGLLLEKSKAFLLSLVFLGALASGGSLNLVAGQKEARITGLVPTHGSLAGGTLLTIHGENLAEDVYSSGTQAFVGKDECIIQHFYSSANRIACVTPPSKTEHSLNVTLVQKGRVVNGGGGGDSHAYTYSKVETPSFVSIEPRSVPVGGVFEVSLNTEWFDYGNWDVRKFKFDANYVQIRVGDQVCEWLEPSGESTTIEFQWGHKSNYPLGHRKVIEVVAPETSGLYNVTVEFVEPKRGLRVQVPESLYFTHVVEGSGSGDYLPYMLSVYPEVDAVSPQNGSIHGGSLVTISGRGFGSSSDDKVQVDLTGEYFDASLEMKQKMVCDVTSRNDSEIVCKTKLKPVKKASKPGEGGVGTCSMGCFAQVYEESNWCSGNCIGWGLGRGILVEQWTMSAAIKTFEAFVEQVIKKKSPDSVSIVQDEGFRATRKGGVRLSSVFHPPETGYYHFHAKAHDATYSRTYPSMLWITHQNGTRSSTTEQLSYSWIDWSLLENKLSESIYLKKGSPILIQALGIMTSRNFQLEVGAFVPQKRRTIASETHLQSFSITTDVFGPISSFKMEGLESLEGEAFVHPADNIFMGTSIPIKSTPKQVETAMKRVIGKSVDFSVTVDNVVTTVNQTVDKPEFVDNSTCKENNVTLSCPPILVSNTTVIQHNFTTITWSLVYSVGETLNEPFNINLSGVSGSNVSAEYFVSRNSSKDLGGSFSLKLGDVSLQNIDYDVSETKLENLFADSHIDARVTRQGNSKMGFTWTAELENNMGLISLNVSDIEGENIQNKTSVSILKNATTDILEKPIPSQWLRVPENGGNTGVEVVVNDAVSACTNKEMCSVSTQSSGMPTILTVDPLVASSGTVLTISGSGFSETLLENNVFLGEEKPVACEIQSAAPSSITCKVATDGSAGLKNLYVVVDGKGSSGKVQLTLQAKLASFSPSSITTQTSTESMITLLGDGFSSNCEENVIKFGDLVCEATECNSSKIKCFVAPIGTGSFPLTMEISSASHTFSDQLLEVVDGSDKEYMSGVEPRTIPAGGGQKITVTGRFVGSSQKVFLVPVRGTDKKILDVECQVLSVSESSLICSCPQSFPETKYNLELHSTAGVIIRSADVLDSVLSISEVYPSQGSLAGGTHLTITGVGFSSGQSESAMAAFVMVPISTTHPSGLMHCDVTSVSSTAVMCTTRAYCSADASPEDPMALKCSYKELQEPTSVVVKICPTTMKDAFGQQFSLDSDIGRLLCWENEMAAESSSCSEPSKCSFRYAENATPLVASAAPLSGLAGSQLEILGTNFRSDSTVSLVGEGLNYVCENIVQVNGSEITCNLPKDMEAGTYMLKVGNPNDGDALSQTIFTVYAEIEKFSPTEGSLGGGNILQITSSGTLFNGRNVSQNEVEVGNSSCTVIEVTGTELRCRVEPSGTWLKFLQDDLNAFVVTNESISLALRLKVNGIDVPSKSNYTVRGDRTPYIQKIDFDAKTSNLTVTGKNFGNDLSAKLENSSNLEKRSRTTSSNQTEVVEYKLDPSAYLSGYYPIQVSNGYGNAIGVAGVAMEDSLVEAAVWSIGGYWPKATFGKMSTHSHVYVPVNLNLPAEISAVISSSTQVSTEGGVLLTVEGSGFHPCKDEESCSFKQVVINSKERGLNCTVKQSSSTSLTCLLEECLGCGESTFSSADLVIVSDSGEIRANKSSAIFSSFQNLTATIEFISQTTASPDLPASFSFSGECKNCAHLNTASSDAQIVLRGQNGEVIVCPDSSIENQKLTFRPTTLIAGTYNVQIQSKSWGNSKIGPELNVSLIISGIESSEGNAAGGQILTVAGVGFGSSNNTVTVGSEICTQLSATHTTMQCKMPALNGTFGQVQVQVKTPYMKAFQTLTAPYNLLESLTPVVSSLHPSAGSTEGGTRLTITGKRFSQMPTEKLSIAIGDIGQCTDISLVAENGSTAEYLTCVTSVPSQKNFPPQKVRLDWAAKGFALGSISYQYADLWSRETTWGKSPNDSGGGSFSQVPNTAPSAGDSVIIPRNTSVLLDVSTPVLNLLVIEGELRFKPSGDEKIELQAHYIFLHKGGKLVIGTEDEPYAGNAAITLHGDMNSKELPVYGAKVIGVREGAIEMYGERKIPEWTRLEETVHSGSSSITLPSGELNWKVGDEIVIASSSFNASEAEVAVIKSIQKGAAKSIIELDAPLKHTHLGVIANFDGETIDMRAEVGCLSRNIKIQGDETFTKKQKYGPHIFIHDHKATCLLTDIDKCGRAETYMKMENVEMSNCGKWSHDQFSS